MKKLFTVVICLVLSMTFAALADQGLRLADVQQTGADVKLFISTDVAPTDDNLLVYLNDTQLDKPLEIKAASQGRPGTVYVFCVDISGTIDIRQFNSIKTWLTSFCRELNENDLMRVYTIGRGAKAVTDYTNNADELKTKLDRVNFYADRTYLWECITLAANDLNDNKNALPPLSQITVLSDGVNVSDNKGSALQAYEALDTSGAAFRLVLMKSQGDDPRVDTSEIETLCEKSGGVMIDGRRSFTDSLTRLHDASGNVYEVKVKDVEYEYLNPGSVIRVDQITERGRISSGNVSVDLSNEGVIRPIKRFTASLNGTPSDGSTLLVEREQDAVIAWETDGEAESFRVIVKKDGAEILSADTEGHDFTLPRDQMEYAVNYEAVITAVPKSAERNQALETSVSFALRPETIGNVTVSVDGAQSAAGGVMLAQKDSAVTVTVDVSGDVKQYEMTLLGEKRVGSENSFVISTANWQVGEIYPCTVTVVPFEGGRIEEGSEISKVFMFTLQPDAVEQLSLNVNGQAAEDGAILVDRDQPIRLSWSAEGDVKSYNYKLTRNGSVVLQDANSRDSEVEISLDDLWAADEFVFELRAVPYAYAADENTVEKIASFGVTPLPIGEASAYLEPAEAREDVYLLPKEGDVSLRFGCTGDVRQTLIALPDGDVITLSSASGTVLLPEDCRAALGETRELTVKYTAFIGSDASVKLKYTVKPDDVEAFRVDIPGAETAEDGVILLSRTENMTAEFHAEGDLMQVLASSGAGEPFVQVGTQGILLANAGWQPGVLYTASYRAVPYEYAENRAEDVLLTMAVKPDTVHDFTLEIEDAETDENGTYTVDRERPLVLTWSAQGDVKEYAVTLPGGETVVTGENRFEYPTDGMALGREYAFTVECVPYPYGETEGETALTLSAALKLIPVSEVNVNIEAPEGADEPAAVAQGTNARVSWTAQGDVRYYKIHIVRDGRTLRAFTGAESPFEISDRYMRLGEATTVEVEAVPWSDEEGQALTSSVEFTLLPVPVSGVTISSSADEDGFVEQNSEVNVSWTAQGDVRGYIVRRSANGRPVDEIQTQETAYAFDSAGMALGETTEIEIEAVPWSEEEGQDTVSSLALKLRPIPVTGVALEVNGEEAGQDVIEIEQNESALLTWRAEGDVKNYVARRFLNGEPVLEEEINANEYIFDAGELSLGDTATVEIEAVPWSDEEGQSTLASASLSLKPVPVSAITADFGEAGEDGTIRIAQGESAEISWTADGDVKNYVVRRVQNGEIAEETQTEEGAYTVSSEDMRVGETTEVQIEAVPWSAEEGQQTTLSASYTLEPKPVRNWNVTLDGEAVSEEFNSVLPDSEVEIVWETDGDVKRYMVERTVGGETLSADEVTEGSYLFNSAGMNYGEDTKLILTAEPWSDDEDQTLTQKITFRLEPRPITQVNLYVDGAPAGTEERELSGENSLAISWDTDGEAEGYRFGVRKNGDLVYEEETTETEYALDVSGLQKGDRVSFSLTAVPKNERQDAPEAVSASFLRPYTPVTTAGWTLDGEPFEPAETFKFKNDAYTVGVQTDGDVRKLTLTMVDADGNEQALPLGEDGLSAEVARKDWKLGKEYTLKAHVEPANPRSAEQDLSMQIVPKPIPWLLIGLIAGGVLLAVLAVLLIVLLKKRKKNGQGTSTSIQPGGGDGGFDLPDEESQKKVAVVTRLRYVQTVAGFEEAGSQNGTQVITNEATIGRSSESDILFSEFEPGGRTVSRRQARLSVDSEGGLYISPAPGTTNPTYVNDREISGMTLLEVGNSIKMGDIIWTITGIEKVSK
ncbi:MAG: FHA domain-containing protein [Clostridia bacterium]|nr:FHA domain-containing protein [Clostridia bacterium]